MRKKSAVWLVEYLAANRVFGSVPNEALHEAAVDIIERRYKKGHYFFQTGDPAGHVFVLVSGVVSLCEDDYSGRDHLLYTFSAGDVFGFATAILGIPRTRSAKALTDAHVLLVERKTLESLQGRYPAFARSVTYEVCRLLCHSEQSASQFALTTVSSRLARLLLDVWPSGANGYACSHRELAYWIGCSRETVTRILGRLGDKGILRTRRARIEILDWEQLKSLAGPTGESTQ
jgi:CRP/FNR family transcriptional regulator